MMRGERNSAGAVAQDARATLLGYSPQFLALAIAVACADNFADPDLWRHLFTGNAIIHGWHLPARDVFSYSAMGSPVRIHEWLADAIFALAYGWFGIIGLKAIKLLCAAVTLSALSYGMLRSAASARIQRVMLLLVAAGLAPQMQFRPQIFTFALFGIEMAILAVLVFKGDIRLWPLVPMFGLWANFHGGFVVGLGALGAAAAVLTMQEYLAGSSSHRGAKLFAIGFLSAVATALNPLGLHIWSNVLHSVSDPLLRHLVLDWVSLPRTLAMQWSTSKVQLLQYAIPVVLMAAFLYAIAAARSLDDAPLAVVGVLLAIAGIEVVRNLALGLIALTIPLAHRLGLRSSANAEQSGDTTREMNPWLVVSLAALVAIVGGLFSPRLATWASVPRDAIGFMDRHNLHGNILNEFEWGDYLIWHMAPASRVFIDGRAELLYPDSTLKEYAQFFYALPGGAEVLEQYHHDFVLLRPATRACRIMREDPLWKLIYHDDAAELFAPATQAIASAPDAPAATKSSSDYFP